MNKNRITGYRCECTLYAGDRCTKSARYEIDNVKICTQHAGPIALRKLVMQKEIKELPVINHYVSNPLCDMETFFDKKKGEKNE